SVFLMDEPLTKLDAKQRVQKRAEIRQIQRTLGVATVYVTHDQVEAMTMGHRVCVMRDGFLQQCDTPQTLYDRPLNLFVAAFIGSPAMNLYDAAMTAGCRSVRLGSQEIQLSDRARNRRPALAAYAERPVVLGIRPENLPGGSDASAPGLTAEVQLVEALGSELQVHFTLDAKRVVAESGEAEELMTSGAGVARVAPHTPAQAGDSIRLGVDVDALHFFDPTSGRAIRD
ncbi:MAG: ABC transporter ATP-binding protein, partial [Solirubrobacteraceae bacterium]